MQSPVAILHPVKQGAVGPTYVYSNAFNEIVKQNIDYNTGFSLMHLNNRSAPKKSR